MNLILHTYPGRSIVFPSFQKFAETADFVIETMEWRETHFPELWARQKQLGMFASFSNVRKTRARIHLRMVARLLYWHKVSVEKLWDPARPENRERIIKMCLEVA